jgi:hypothetical protein
MKFLSTVLLCYAVSFLGAVTFLHGQSSDLTFPTHVLTSEVAGTIRPRAIGDARATTHYYAFNGQQGDIFVNVSAQNFNGDVDIYAADGLRLLTRIPIFSDRGETETGRVIYLRRPERLLMRVQGRTMNDEAAVYRIKFAGSFVAMTQASRDEAPTLEHTVDGPVRVDSAGRIIEVKPSPKQVAEESNSPDGVAPVTTAAKRTETATPSTPAKPAAPVRNRTSEDVRASRERSSSAAGATTTSTRRNTPVAGTNPSRDTPAAPEKLPIAKSEALTSRAAANKPAGTKKTTTESETAALEKINLVILMKDGSIFQRPMNEVVRFNVDKGVLTVLRKDGKTSRYSLLEVLRVTIE